jgi:hypothetical protein
MRIKFRLKFDRNEIRRKIDLELIFRYNLHRFHRTERGSLKILNVNQSIGPIVLLNLTH